jgi:hypothetical protein
MSDVTSMWKQLRSHRILLDTFSDIQPEPKRFLRLFESVVPLDPIPTPIVVIVEPTDLSLIAQLNCAGRRAIEQRIHSYFETIAETFLKKSDNLRGQVVLSIPLQNQPTRSGVMKKKGRELLHNLPKIWSTTLFKPGCTLGVHTLSSNDFAN